MSLSSRLAVLLILVASWSQALGGELALGDFARNDGYMNAKISPQGEYLALSRWVGSQVVIEICDLRQKRFISILRFPMGMSAGDFWWAGPSRLVAQVGVAYGALEQIVTYGELYAINADGSQGKYLFGFRGDMEVGSHRKRTTKQDAWGFMVDPLIHDPEHALIAIWPWSRSDMTRTRPWLDKINIHTGLRERIASVPLYDPQVLADRSGQARIAIGHDTEAECCRMVTRAPGKAEDWETLALRVEEVKLHGLTANDTAALLSLSTDGTPTCLHEFRFADRKLIPLDCNNSADVDGVTMSFDGQTPLSVRYEDGRPQTVYLAPDHPDARLLRSLEKSFAGERIQVTSGTADGSKVLLLVDGDRNPGDFFLLDRGTKKAAYLFSRRKWIDPKTMQPVEPVRYEARDGTALNGYLTRGAGVQAGKAPLVLMPHGGPFGVRDRWEWNPDAQLLASRGYSVLQVNFRGSGGYGENFQKTARRKWASLMQDDLTDGVKWAIAAGHADPARICIYGASFGGYAAVMSSIREPGLYACAVTFAGVSDLVTQTRDTDYADAWISRDYTREQIGANAAELREQSPVTHVHKLRTPVLIAHGTKDRRVPFSQAKQLRDALDEQGKPYEWLEFKGEEHGLFKDENRVLFYEKLLDFLDRHIGARSGG